MHPKKTIFNIAEAKAHFFDAARTRAMRGNHRDRQSRDAMRAKAFFEPLSEEELRLWEGE
jgi:hypothetical protein